MLHGNEVSPLADGMEANLFERKVLRAFVADERLLGIPTIAGKRAVILRWAAAQFAPGICYREREVNDILARHYADTNTLRRMLIDHRLLKRTPDGREYWRVTGEPIGSAVTGRTEAPPGS